jgi:uncharacterized protein (DUF4415 family)
MNAKTMKKALDPVLLEQLSKVAAMSDDDIDTDDIPEAAAENWSFARRGGLYKPLKKPVTIRLDADVLDWFKRHGVKGRYQTEINRVLRGYVAAMERKPHS